MPLYEALGRHAEQIAEIEMECFDNAFNEHTIRKELEAGRGWVWMHGGRVVGYAMARAQEGLADITRLAVRGDWRGKGIGAALLLGALARLKGPVILFVQKNNRVAIRMYIKHGFDVVAVADDSWVLRKKA